MLQQERPFAQADLAFARALKEAIGTVNVHIKGGAIQKLDETWQYKGTTYNVGAVRQRFAEALFVPSHTGRYPIVEFFVLDVDAVFSSF